MDSHKIADIRRRLAGDQEKLIKSINRSRLAVEDIKVENTEDEGDLATISHDRDLIYNLHESEFARLRHIQEAIKAIDSGGYGDCVRCGEDITERRLAAVPWARMCIRCQEDEEMENTSARHVLSGSGTDDEEP